MFKLSKEDLQLVRKADHISFHIASEKVILRMTKMQRHNGPFGGEYEIAREIIAPEAYPLPDAFFSSYDVRYGGWSALKVILKEGDILSFQVMDNSPRETKDAGIRYEQLLVNVAREGKAIVRDMILQTALTHFQAVTRPD